MNMANHCAQLDKRVNDIESKLANYDKNLPNINGTTTEDIIAEATERKKRTKNVIAYNVSESKKQMGLERLRDDNELIAKILPQESVDILPNIKLRRIGRPVDGKTRPLLINTPSETDARKLIITKSVCMGNDVIFFKPDLTRTQQIHMKNLRNELNVLNKDGQTDRIIKYINGIPRIVKLSTFRLNKETQKVQTGFTGVLSEHQRTQN